MSHQEIEKILAEVGIRPTSVRLLVYEAISKINHTFSLADLEKENINLEHSSIFRTLTLFHEHHLIHEVDDGSGSTKYCLCTGHGICHEGESHLHFFCVKCHTTFCIRENNLPQISMPEGYTVMSTNFLVKGVCPQCANKSSK
ncbi:MAG: transcriptional repressor [Bacteroidales bacterium]|nr:transcriptional repressor [Bacteroidales bacterium]